ncbi:hypothetical protein [Corallococcus sp. Z5C101001]|uniref:hypothetical protein n=1 Tax=Corallococcus sp. Z5C101001 TaxID=2596829 RepID=UPI0011800585|nr:hypothetical protein [Corallococcus sp. Z5C101001]TSC31424.1 hypothetical protein FOF48_12170 [Corallococcus sp. Z5C101001]
MRVHPPSSLQRVAFLGEPAFEPHVPVQAAWAEVRFFPVTAGRWKDAIGAAQAWGANATLVFRPQDLTPELAARLPGSMSIGVIPAPLFSADEMERLSRMSGPDVKGFRWLTYLETPTSPELARLPLLQTLPLPVDTARCPTGPRLDCRRVLVADWASPTPEALEALRKVGPVDVLPSQATAGDITRALEQAGTLVYASRDLMGRFDPLPLLAMAHGLLVIADTVFAPEWNIEPEDEFLYRPDGQWARSLDETVRMPVSFRAVRIRAWQKMREAFDASACFQRVLHDAHLFADPVAHLASLRPVGPPVAVPVAVEAARSPEASAKEPLGAEKVTRLSRARAAVTN